MTLVEGDLAITKVDAVLDHTPEEVAFILVHAIKQLVVLEENRKWKKIPGEFQVVKLKHPTESSCSGKAYKSGYLEEVTYNSTAPLGAIAP